ncbi:MAG TPA: OsmC family protein [Bacteroidales bacterium]|nr:OsmC family protein [Bacteroidales bacterium]
MKHTVDTSWKGNMMFEANVSGHPVVMDALPEVGGGDQGARPKELMLAALAGCTGMDVVSILKKMRVPFTGVNIRVEADVTEEHPKHYERMHIIYEFSGENLPMEQLKKAVELSQDRYCGVSFVYKKAMPVSYEIRVTSH